MTGKKPKKVSSHAVFMSYVTSDGDATRIVSKECYQSWVSTRKAQLKQPEESFRRVLTAHVCGLIGRKPFPADVEANLLRVLRKKEVWPCFKGTGITIGIKGFRKPGFHESRRDIFGANAGSSLTTTPSHSSPPTNTIKLNPRLMMSTQKNTEALNTFSTSPNVQNIPQVSLNSLSGRGSPENPLNTTTPQPIRLGESSVVSRKRPVDVIDPFVLLNNSSTHLQPYGLMNLNPAKRFHSDKTQEGQIGLQPALYSSFILTGFQDVHVPSVQENGNTNQDNNSNSNWPLN